MPLDGRQGLRGVVEIGGDIALSQHVGGHAADARTARRAVVVHAHHDVGDAALLDHADDGVGDVYVVAEQRLQVVVRRGGGFGGRVEDFAAPLFDRGVLDLVVDGVQGVESVAGFGLLEGRAQAYQLAHGLLVGDRNEDVVLLLGLFVVVLRIAHGDVVRAPLRGEGRDRAGGQNHQDRAVEHAFAQQADRLAVGRVAQYDVVADHHRRERRRDMGAAQSEDHGALVR